jgi:hypothetical protein
MVSENQTRQAISQTLLAFDKAVEPGATAFFFYAGHGFEIAGQNFLLPTDVPAATERSEELVRDASVLAARIIEHLQNKKVRTAILVFEACRNNPPGWLSFRELNGLLVYYTHLISYRCAIREVRVGIDSAVPDKVLKMPPCDPRDPSVIPHDAQPYRKLSPSTKTVSVELTYRDGSVSEIKSFRR